MNTPAQHNTLIQLLCQISKEDDMASALECLLTAKELHEITNRLTIFEKLEQQIPQREIAASLGVGIVTVTRGARAFKEGRFAALQQFLPATKTNDTPP